MPSSGLLHTQKSAIVTLLRARGIDAAAFDVQDTEEKFKATHRETGYYLLITFSEMYPQYRLSCSPGDDRMTSSQSGSSWQAVLPAVERWGEHLREELSIGNLWEDTLDSAAALTLGSSAQSADRPFNQEELQRIVEGLERVRGYIADLRLPENHQRFVEDRLKFLEEAARTAPRVQWLQTGIGVIVTIAIGVGMAPVQAKALFSLAAKVAAGVFGGQLPLLP